MCGTLTNVNNYFITSVVARWAQKLLSSIEYFLGYWYRL